jgi:hypothetical protein
LEEESCVEGVRLGKLTKSTVSKASARLKEEMVSERKLSKFIAGTESYSKA